MGSDTELDSQRVLLTKLLEQFSSLRTASPNEINMLKEANSALNALKEKNSALKKINIELEETFDMTCSFQADQLNKNAKDKINDEEASALAYRKLEAESNRKITHKKARG